MRQQVRVVVPKKEPVCTTPVVTRRKRGRPPKAVAQQRKEAELQLQQLREEAELREREQQKVALEVSSPSFSPCTPAAPATVDDQDCASPLQGPTSPCLPPSSDVCGTPSSHHRRSHSSSSHNKNNSNCGGNGKQKRKQGVKSTLATLKFRQTRITSSCCHVHPPGGVEESAVAPPPKTRRVGVSSSVPGTPALTDVDVVSGAQSHTHGTQGNICQHCKHTSSSFFVPTYDQSQFTLSVLQHPPRKANVPYVKLKTGFLALRELEPGEEAPCRIMLANETSVNGEKRTSGALKIRVFTQQNANSNYVRTETLYEVEPVYKSPLLTSEEPPPCSPEITTPAFPTYNNTTTSSPSSSPTHTPKPSPTPTPSLLGGHRFPMGPCPSFTLSYDNTNSGEGESQPQDTPEELDELDDEGPASDKEEEPASEPVEAYLFQDADHKAYTQEPQPQPQNPALPENPQQAEQVQPEPEVQPAEEPQHNQECSSEPCLCLSCCSGQAAYCLLDNIWRDNSGAAALPPSSLSVILGATPTPASVLNTRVSQSIEEADILQFIDSL